MATEVDGETAHGQQGIWKQREETVFQINDQFRRFWHRGDYNLGQKNGNGDVIAYFVPIMFDKANRTFNWVAAANPVLAAATSGYDNSSYTKYAQDALPTVLKTLYGAFFKNGDEKNSDEKKNLRWQKFEDRYSDQPGAFKEYIEFVYETVENYGSKDSTGSESLLSNEQVKRFWTATLMAYSCYSHPSDQNFEGIFYRILERLGHTEPEKIADAIFGVAKDQWLDLTDWKNARGSSFPECPHQDADGHRKMREANKGGGLRYSKSRIEEVKILRSAFLDHLLMKWDWGGETFEKVTQSHNFRLLVPIYDVWSGTQGWGGLKAVVVVLLKPPSGVPRIMHIWGRQTWKAKIGNPAWQRNYEIMLERCGEFAQEIGQAATRRALSRPIVPPYDLVRQFLHILIEVQDWEEAVVFYGRHPEYRFKRIPRRKSETRKPIRQGWFPSELSKSETNDGSRSPSIIWSDNDGNLSGPFDPSNGLKKDAYDAGAFYMWWTSQDEKGCQDLWSEPVLPGLSSEERAIVSDTSIRFKFPKACRIPSDAEAKQFLVDSYRRQQLELMRGLIPKVRARRAALRNAVSAIMGRNMSHNIGSHVLARYAAEVGKTTIGAQRSHAGSGNEKIDPAADFLSYLQRRMDFLAEVATSDNAFWTQPLLLGTQLNRLNSKHERERLRDGCTPLLTYITGKTKLPANVEFDEATACTLFSCPGGEVGVHALYVILENVIRNSARHNPEHDGKVQIMVCIENQTKYSGLIKLRITDTGSNIQGDKNLAQDINNIITRKHILDDDGRPHSQYWGLREMQICAQYLRQLQLSDLEDVPYAEQDMTAKAMLIEAEGKPGDCLSYVIYLREAKPLAKIEIGDKTELGDMKYGVAQVTLSRALIAPEQESRPEDALREERDVLRQIRNYIFVAYNGKDANLDRWAERHARDLPLRRLTDIPFKDGRAPELLLESLYEALAKQIQETPDSERAGDKAIPLIAPAGLALAGGEAISKPKSDDVSEDDGPLTIKDVTTDRPWGSWIDRKCWSGDVTHQDCNKHRLDACIWLDHPSLTDVCEYSGKSGPLIRSIAVEPVFSHSPAAEAIRALNPGEGWELIAAALPRIVVLDERVQAAGNNEVRSALKAKHCWPGMHVEVPTTEQTKLDGPEFDACHFYLVNLEKSAAYVILHLTVLEKLNDERRRKDANETHLKTVEELISGTPAESATIMIVTGRGVSTFARSESDLALAKRVRYLPVSALLEYLTRRPSKLGLMRVLWSASSPWREPDAKSNPHIS
jgi:hypothetical protein